MDAAAWRRAIGESAFNRLKVVAYEADAAWNRRLIAAEAQRVKTQYEY